MPQVYCALCPDGASAVWLSDKKGLHQHLTQVHAGKTACLECGSNFKAPLDLQSHTSAKHPMNLKCASCPLLFSSQSGLASHVQAVHAPKEDHVCTLCGSVFPTAIAHVGHMKSNHSGLNHVCGLGGCTRAFKTSAARQQHVSDAHPRRSTCTSCSVPFPTPEALAQHAHVKHPPPASPTFPCDECGKVLVSSASVAQHKNEQHRFACGPCGTVFASSVALAQHTVESHRIPCAHCGAYVKTDAELKAHRKAKHLRFECMSCCADFASAGELNAHLEATHYVRCAQCLQTFVSREEMELHADLVHSFPCALCEEYFATERELAEHSARTHVRYPCDRCAEKLGSQADLDAHVEREHPPPPPMFSCGFCELGFATLEEAEEHGYAAHTCVTCLMTGFLSREALDEHVGEHRYPFKCDVCNTRYTEEEELSEHFRQVPDVHPVCARCGLGFEASEDLVQHVESFHPRIPCELCDGQMFESEDLPKHWFTSSKHPSCYRCSAGFPNHQAFIEHGSYQHPDTHCILCQFQFDTTEGLENHIKHFSNHPQCDVCGTRFADNEEYHNHLIEGHRPLSPDPDHARRSSWPESIAATSTAHEDTPFITAPATPPARRISLPVKKDSPSYAAIFPLPASVSQVSSPRSLRRASLTSSGTRASIGGVTAPMRRGSPLARDQGRLSLSGFDSIQMDVAPSSPQSNVAVLATPTPEKRFSTTNYGDRIPINATRTGTPPTPNYFDSPRLVSSPRRIASVGSSISSHNSRRVPRLVIDDDHSTSSDDSPVSPQLTSPSEGLPEIEQVAPTPTSDGWSSPSSSKLSPTLPSAALSAPASNVAQQASTFRSPQESSRKSSTDVTTIMMPSMSQIKVPFSSPGRPQRSFMLPSQSYLTVPHRVSRPSSVSITPSSISPQSAVIPLSGISPGGMTPDFVREARAYLAITNGPQAQMQDELVSPPKTPPQRTRTPRLPPSPGLSSPYAGGNNYGYLSSGQRREVHFEESLMDERWDVSQSHSSGVPSPTTPLKSPITIQLPKVNGQPNGSSRLPRWTPPKSDWKASNGWTYDSYRVDHMVGSPQPNVANESTVQSKFNCRVCSRDAGEQLTATMCGHLFCNQCITNEVKERSQCPVCKSPQLLYCLFRIHTD